MCAFCGRLEMRSSRTLRFLNAILVCSKYRKSPSDIGNAVGGTGLGAFRAEGLKVPPIAHRIPLTSNQDDDAWEAKNNLGVLCRMPSR